MMISSLRRQFQAAHLLMLARFGRHTYQVKARRPLDKRSFLQEELHF
jgi:hypothetical protein